MDAICRREVSLGKVASAYTHVGKNVSAARHFILLEENDILANGNRPRLGRSNSTFITRPFLFPSRAKHFLHLQITFKAGAMGN